MTSRQLYSCDLGSELQQLYESAFPVEEQIPWTNIVKLVDSMHLDVTSYYDNEEMIGFTIVYPRPSYNWFWYFAVKPELRGRGIGQTILSMLIKKYENQSNIMDIEQPRQDSNNAEQRRRRHDFYVRNGFRDTGVGRTFDGAEMTILMNGEGTFTMNDYDQALSELKEHLERLENEKSKS